MTKDYLKEGKKKEMKTKTRPEEYGEKLLSNRLYFIHFLFHQKYSINLPELILYKICVLKLF